MDLKEIIDKYSKQFEGLEIFYQEKEVRPVEFKNNKLFSMDSIYNTGYSVRVIHQGKIGFSSSTNIDEIDQVIDSAKQSSLYGINATFDFPVNQDAHNELNNFDENIIKYPDQEKIQLLQKAIDQVLSHDKSLNCEAELTTVNQKSKIINSKGLFVEKTKTSQYIYLIALLVEKEGGFQEVFKYVDGTKIINNIDNLINDLIQQIEYSKKIISLQTDKMPVIIMPFALRSLLLGIQYGANGKMLQKGLSPLQDKIGKKVFDEGLTITDQPFLKDSSSSCLYDDEGVPSQETVIIQDGVLQNFIFDCKTASLLNKKSTGNAKRDYKRHPGPGYSNFVLNKGDEELKDIIGGIKKGIIVENVIGGGQSNIVAGDYSVNIGLGFFVEDGQIKGRIKNAMLAGNIYEDFLNNIGAISQETYKIPGIKTPVILLKNKKITAK